MKERKILMENMAALFIVQGANYILPLVTFPYLVRVLGLGKFGLIAFAFSFVQYFVVFVDYGFNLSATRGISIVRNDFNLISRKFWNIFIIKSALLIISAIILSIMIISIEKFKINAFLYLMAFIAVLGNLFFPIWFFQGIEDIKIIAFFNLISKLFFTAAIFMFIKDQNDYTLAVFLQSSGVLFAGIAAFVYALLKYPIKFVLPNYDEIKTEVKQGWPIFATIMSSTLVNNSNIFILGIYADNKIVGIFAIADKIVRVFINLCVPVSNAIFPRVSSLFEESKVKAVKFIKKILLYGSIFFAAMCVLLYFTADVLVMLITGENVKSIGLLIRIMSIVPLTVFVDNLYGTQVLININRSSQFMKAVLYPGMLSVALSFLLVPVWKQYASSVIFVVSELIILVMMISYVNKNNVYLVKESII